MIENIIENIKTILNIEEKEIKNLKRFEKGMSNYTYYFEANNFKYVIRLIGEGAEKYINYYNELNASLAIYGENLTSELIYFDPVTGTKLVRYIDGEVLDFEKIENFDELIKSLKKLHGINNKSIKEYDLINRLNEYESFNEDNKLSDDYFSLKKWWFETYNLEYKNEELVLCHNDLQDANIINTNDKIYFIDFEYTAYNDLYYDFASFEENAYLVHEKYFNKALDNNDKNHIDFFKIYQSIQWYLVALYKHSIGFSEKTSHDFNELKDYFINKAKNLFEIMEMRNNK